MTTQTFAQQALAAIAPDSSDPWGTFRAHGMDEEATQEADPGDMQTIAVFRDGSELVYLEHRGRWDIKSDQPDTRNLQDAIR